MNASRNKNYTHEGGIIDIHQGQNFTPEQIQEIRDTAIMYSGDRNAAARYLGIHPASVENHARDLLKNNNSLSENKINIIRQILPILNYRILKTAQFTQIGTQQIKECLEKGYVDMPHRVYINSPTQEEQNAIIKSFDKHGKINMVHQELGIDKASISKVLQINGIQINSSEKSKLDRMSIITAYKIYNKNAHRTALALGIDRATIEKTRYRFHLGSVETTGLTDKEIYDRYKDKNLTKQDLEKMKKSKLKQKLKKELTLIKKYKDQIDEYLVSKGCKPSVTRASKEIGIFDTTGVRKLSHYGLFDIQTHSFDTETSKLPIFQIFEMHCNDHKLLTFYNELFSKYNTDKKMKEHKIKNFIIHHDSI